MYKLLVFNITGRKKKSDSNEPTIELIVAEAKNRDVIRGKIRIDNKAMKAIGVSTGDEVEIIGKNKNTAAIAWPSYPEDINRNIIRMDGVIRGNCGASINEKVMLATNVSVLIGIVFLAVELNQNSIGQNVAAKQEMTRQFSDYMDLLLFNPELSDLNNRGLRGEELNETETQQFGFLLNKATWYFAAMHYQYVAQSLSEEEWHQSRTLIGNYCTYPGFIEWWQGDKDSYSPGFVEYIESHWEKS